MSVAKLLKGQYFKLWTSRGGNAPVLGATARRRQRMLLARGTGVWITSLQWHERGSLPFFKLQRRAHAHEIQIPTDHLLTTV